MSAHDRITYDEDGTLDEVVLTGPEGIHLERMGEAQWWLGIDYAGETLHVNIGAINHQAKGYGHAAWDSPGGRPDGAPAAEPGEE